MKMIIIISDNEISYYTRLVLGISHCSIASCSYPAALEVMICSYPATLEVNFIAIFLLIFKVPILFNNLLDLISQAHRGAIARCRGVNP